MRYRSVAGDDGPVDDGSGAAASPGIGGQHSLFIPNSPEQVVAADVIRRCDITFLRGEAGSGKTHVALGVATELLQAKQINRIVLVRPLVPAGEETGFLKGTLAEKLAPWVDGFKDCLGSLTFEDPDQFFEKYVDVRALAYMRGRTLSRAVAILDEAQNCSVKQLKLFMSRLGPRSKLIILGDTEQTDTAKPSRFDEIVGCLDQARTVGEDGTVYRIGSFILRRQCRSPLVKLVNSRLRHLS